MEYRILRPEEMEQVEKLSCTAFLYKPRADKRAFGEHEHEVIHGAFDDQKNLTAMVYNHQFTARYEGLYVPIRGLGGVSSRPETRRQGNIRKLITDSLREGYETGALFSALYPFSHVYYRQFGYELCCPRYEATFPVSALKGFKAPDAEEFTQGADDTEIRALYRDFIAERNLACDREGECVGRSLWKFWLGHDPLERLTFTYIIREGGKAVAYVQLKFDEEGEARRFSVTDAAWRDGAGLKALLGFLYLTGGEISEFKWKLPCGVNPKLFLPEPYDVSVKAVEGGMARAVRVADCLRLLRPPEGEGQYSLRVEDKELPENSGVYTIAFAGGETKVKQSKDGSADMECSVQTLTQLLLGSLSFDEARQNRFDLQVAGNDETLRRVFTKRFVQIDERF